MHRRDSSPRAQSAEPESAAAPAAGARWRARLAAGGVLLLALAVRLLPWPRIFTDRGVLLAADGDTHYHALRAAWIAAAWPRVPWFDPGMNHPFGAEVPWPPLLDQLVATAAVATGGAAAQHVAAVAAFLPVVAGVAVVAVVAAQAGALTGGGLEAAVLVALLPAAVRQGFVGRADHHVLETLLSSSALLLVALGTRRAASWGRRLALGAVLALSFWNWAGSAMYLLLLAGIVAGLHLASPAGEQAPGRASADVAAGALAAAVLLAVTVGAWGPPGALPSTRLTPITGLSVVLCALTALGAAAVHLARRRDPGAGPGRRAMHLVGAIAIPLLVLAALPRPWREGVVHGGTAVTAATGWYESISEFWPVLLSGRQPLGREALLALLAYGLTPFLLPVAVVAGVRAWREAPDRRPALVLLLVWTGVMVLLAVFRRRFEGYALVPLAVCGGWATRWVGARLAPRLGARRATVAGAALVVLALAPGAPLALTGWVGELPAGADEKRPVLEWLRTAPVRPGREGVLSVWSEGHEIRWFAGRPVVSTPFGTDIDPRSLVDEATFFTTQDPDSARRQLERRRVGHLLLVDPVREVATVGPLAPGAPRWAFERLSVAEGSTYDILPGLLDLVVSRLFFADGVARERAAGLADYRLVAESATPVKVLGVDTRVYKLFEVVPGARLEVAGASPGAPVRAFVRVTSPTGRAFQWSGEAVADAGGVAVLRVPYATGANGLSVAGPVAVGDAASGVAVAVPEAAVVEGGRVAVRLR